MHIAPPSLEYLNKTLGEIENEAQACQKCALAKTRTKVVFAQGKAPCSIMLIGEGPGRDEDLQGIPFVGRSGKLLTKMLESIDIKRPDNIYIANTVKCRPPQNRDPLKSEISACNDYLRAQIYHVKPRVLLLSGSPSMKTILNTTTPISKIRGKWIDIKVDYMPSPLKTMVIFHPSYLLRNPSNEKGKPKWLVWQDLKEVKRMLEDTA
jgi:uracil-DNA glycosylase